MKKKKEKVQTKPTSGAIYLNEGVTLAELIKQAEALGITDFSKVRYDHDYVGCHADHGDGYCYCPSSYADMRFDWEI